MLNPYNQMTANFQRPRPSVLLSFDKKFIVVNLPNKNKRIRILHPDQIIEECKGTTYTAIRIFHRTLVAGLKDEPYRPCEVREIALKLWSNIRPELKAFFKTLNTTTKRLLKTKIFILDQWCNQILKEQDKNRLSINEESRMHDACPENAFPGYPLYTYSGDAIFNDNTSETPNY
jgi:hypothetical protein